MAGTSPPCVPLTSTPDTVGIPGDCACESNGITTISAIASTAAGMTHRSNKARLLAVMRVAVALLAQVGNLCGQFRQRRQKRLPIFPGLLPILCGPLALFRKNRH